MKKDVVLVDIIGEVVSSMKVAGISSVNYEPGKSGDVLKSLIELDNSHSFKGRKYPLLAMLLPVRIYRETEGYYGKTRVPRIIIATLTNSTDNIFKRYKEGGTFKSILYPCYYEFLNCLAKSPNIIGSDPDGFSHAVEDNPGAVPVGTGSPDYIDAIEILNLELILNQIKTC